MSDAQPRLADVLGALSAATDLAVGVPIGTSVRTCLAATRLGQRLGQTGEELACTYYTALLRHLGCTAFSYEAAWYGAGDDHALLRTFEDIEPTQHARIAVRTISRLSKHAEPGARLRSVTRTLTSISAGRDLAIAQCEQAVALAGDLAMGERVQRALGQIYERFAGSGSPAGLCGEEIEPSARVLHIASTLEIQHRHGGRDAAREALLRGSGKELDPQMCTGALAEAEPLWDALEAPSPWDAYLEAEPDAPRRLEDLDSVALAFARYADLKSPPFLGHSPRVADLAAAAGMADGLGPHEVAVLRRAALLHDLGVVAVPNGIWQKAGPLDAFEGERVRMHAYYTARVLARVPALSAEARIAGLHHERCDGSGYPGGVLVGSSERAARILACADAYRGLVESRPHRPAMSPAEAATVLRHEAAAGRLCARAVDRVLEVAGHVPRLVSQRPAGLTEREVEVLVQLAQGQTTKEIAAALNISPRTAQHHVEHIYAKIGVSTRAAAALFAVRHDLVPDPPC